jgi:type I restriction enzyme S subunit
MAVAQDLGATVLPAGTIVFPKVGGALLTNKRRIAANQCCIDNNMMGCVVRNGNRDFLFLIMNYIDLGQIAKPGPVPAISEGEVREIRVALPSAPEQTAIVRFLDWAERRIRRYIRAKQNLIKLLEEYKQVLIHRAVTGQIDVRTGRPYPAYKDSGIEWLGKVPAHWDVRRLKTAVYHINEQTSTKNDEDLCIALEHVESWTGRLLVASGEAQFDSQVKRFQAGDVLFGKLRPYLAKVVRPKQSGVCVGEFFVLRARPVVAPHYLEVVLRSAPAIDFVNSSTYGAKMPRADWTFVGAMLFPLPPLPEQTTIVEYLDAQTTKIDAAIAAARREIELLREYRTRLIADVVTGKADVREVAAQLPEEPPEDIEAAAEEAEGEGEIDPAEIAESDIGGDADEV